VRPRCLAKRRTHRSKRWFFETRLDYLGMCATGPEWPRDYDEHLRLYKGSGIAPDVNEDAYIPEFHDGPAAIRLALDYLQDHDGCRAGLDPLKHLVDSVGLDLAAVMERWQRLRPIFMPKHVAELQQMNLSGPLTELFDDAVRAYVCGAPAAAFAMCRPPRNGYKAELPSRRFHGNKSIRD